MPSAPLKSTSTRPEPCPRMTNVESVLATIPLFSSLSASDLGAIARQAISIGYRKSTVVIQEGDTADSLYVVASGRLKAFLDDESGKEIILSIMGPGEYFGEIALLDEAPRSASVMTIAPSRLLIISRSVFKDCLANNPNAASTIVNNLTHRLRRTTQNVKSLALENVQARVLSALRQLAKPENGRHVIGDRLTHQDIANLIGSSREMVSRVIKDLSASGYISVEEHKIYVDDSGHSRR